MTLGGRIRAARTRLPRVTLEKIAEYFGISAQAVSQWEHDGAAPDLEKIPKLARILKVPIEWLLDGGESPPPPAELSLLARLQALSDEDRALIEALVERLERPSLRGR
jgi:transcriptional regulator with XRE-family HTH domain